MNNASVAILAKLREELRAVMDRAAALAVTARFRRMVSDAGDIVAMLDPTEEQRFEGAQLAARLRRWGSALGSLLRRNASGSAGQLDHLVNTAEAYVLLQRRTPPEMTEGRWRSAFENELTRLRLQLEQVLGAADWQRTPSPCYEPLDVDIDAVEDGHCDVTIHAEFGSATARVPIPFTRDEQNALLEIYRRPKHGVMIAQLAPLTSFGGKLFSILTGGPLTVVYQQFCATAGKRQARSWVRLQLCDADFLAQAPWELLHDGADFLALRSTDITRSIESSGTPAQAREFPSRVLVTTSSPRGLRALDAARESQLLEQALGGWMLIGQIELDFAPDGTLDTLRRMLRAARDMGRPYSGWHFIGHGRYNAQAGRGELAMTAEDGAAHYVGGAELAVLFDDARLDFAVLNACETGVGGIDHPRHGLAATLMDCGAGAIVAMQFQVSDQSAITLSEELYGSIAAGADVLAAVAEARRAMFCRSEGVEWMTPVLFLRGTHANTW